MLLINDFLKLLVCPDDGTAIALRNRFLECPKCSKKYPILGNNFVEILPSNFPDWGLKENEPKKAEEFYLQEFKATYCRIYKNTG